MTELSLNLTLAEINHILEALGQLPYAQVYQLIGKVQAQAEAQLQANEAGTPETAHDNLPSVTQRVA